MKMKLTILYKNLFLLMFTLLLMSLNNPSIAILSLMLFMLIYLFLLKNIFSCLLIYLIILIYLGGILLLLFYVSMLYSNKFYNKMNFISLFLLWMPLFKILKIEFSFFSLNNNFNNLIILLYMMLLIIFVILMLNNLMFKLNFMRQV